MALFFLVYEVVYFQFQDVLCCRTQTATHHTEVRCDGFLCLHCKLLLHLQRSQQNQKKKGGSSFAITAITAITDDLNIIHLSTTQNVKSPPINPKSKLWDHFHFESVFATAPHAVLRSRVQATFSAAEKRSVPLPAVD